MHPHLLVVQLELSTGPTLRQALMRTWSELLGVHAVTDVSALCPDLSLDDVVDLASSKRQEAG